MSWGTCYSGSNNIHFNFPPIMADGRNYATWQPEAVINNRIRRQENITSNWQYRQYMTNNGIQLMKYNNEEACYDLGLNPHIQTTNTPSSKVPIMLAANYDTYTPGYGYPQSNLKTEYLTREQLQARMIAPSIVVPSKLLQ